MGSCSLKAQPTGEKQVQPIIISQNILTTEEEKKVEGEIMRQRVSKIKQKGALLEVRKGSIPVMDAPTAQVKEVNKSSRDVEIIEKSFEKHFIFTTLTQDQKKVVIQAMKLYTLASNQTIFHQNQPGTSFFIVASGLLEVLVNDVRINTITEGQGFGELALMHDSPRTATVRTLTTVTLWGLDRNSFKKIIEDLNVKHYEENKAFIESVSVFAILKPAQIESLVGSLVTFNYAPGQVVVKEGDIGDLLFIIKEGIVSCTRKNIEIKKFIKGEYFGEQALIYNSPRTATCIALTNVKCLCIDRENLNTALGSQLQAIIFKNSQSIVIEKSEVLNKLSHIQAENLINTMEIKKCQSGDILIEAGTVKNSVMVMILKGKVLSGIDTYEKFTCIGAEDIIEEDEDKKYDYDLIVDGETDIAIITKSEFEKSIGGKYQLVTDNNQAFMILKHVQLFRGLSNDKIHSLLAALKIEKYAHGQVIVEQNSEGDAFYIVKTGKVEVSIDDHVVRTITKHDYFGERSVIFNQKRTATVTASGNVECWILFQVDFMRIIDQGLRTHLMKRIELQEDNLTLEDLSCVKMLGKGMFGNVFLTIHKTKKIFYALKTVDRRKIYAYELQESLILERKVLMQLDHIFIMKLVKTLKDHKRIYFVLEYVRGMDLFDVIRKMPMVSEEDSRFYTACLIVILQHLHDRDIIYRDLKPENVVVDEEGYLKLIDFGTAKIVNGRTYTIVGTPHYMAPEVILRKGYTVAVDYWSLGIVLYELLFEKVPFAEEEEDPMIVYEIVLTARLRYPRIQKPIAEVKSVIDQLLNKNPSLRMGAGFEKLKSHPWFSFIDWEKLLSKDIKAPYIPKVKKLDPDLILEHMRDQSLNSFLAKEETDNLPEPSAKSSSKWDVDF